jgi:tetratricopeptide (TPR) repeat protein
VSIALPGTDRVPDGPQRDLLVRLHELYGQAGKPATRFISRRIDEEGLESVSYETISALLRGKSVPSWARLNSIIIVLCRMSVHSVDVRRELVHFNVLWRRVDSWQSDSAQALAVVRPYMPPLPPLEADQTDIVPAVVTRVHGPLPERAALFTGREKLLDDIESRLARDPGTPLILFGPIGSGKTQLAAEYVRLHRDQYAVTWWVEAENAERGRESLLGLAGSLWVAGEGDERRPIDQMFQLLARSGPYLLVFDGVISGDVRTLIRTAGGSVLVTTRNGGWARESHYAELEVPDLDAGESAQLLRKQDQHMTQAQMSRIASVVGRSPVGLAVACRLCREQGTSWDDLADRLATPANRLLTLTPDGTPSSSRLTEEVRAIAERLIADPDLRRLLTLLLGFGPSQVWRWMLQAGADHDVSPNVGRLLRDPDGLQNAMRILAGAGLGRRHAGGDWIEIPDIIRLVLRELLPAAYADSNRLDVVQILVAADPGHPEDPRTLDKHRAIAPHVRPAALVDTHRPAVYRTIRHQIRYLFLTGDLQAAQQLGREAESALARQQVLAPSDELFLLIRRDFASALRADGRYADAYRLTEEAMAHLDDRADHAVALDLARNRGHDLRIAGEFQRAYELDELTLRRHLAVFSDDDFRSVASRYNLSVSRRFLGRFREAAAADRSDLDRLRPGGNRADRRQARWANALAEDLYGLGRYSDVVELLGPLIEAESGRELLRARRMTGVAFRRLGKLVPAVEQLGVCYQACMSQLGERRELTLAVCMSFGNALRELGQFPTALHYCSLAVSGYAAVMGANNPLVRMAGANRAAVYLAAGEANLAKAQLDDAHAVLSDRLGERHPFTVLTAVNRASAVAMSDPVSAWEWSGPAYQRARELFGDDHLDTLIAAAGYAVDRSARNEDDPDAPSLDQILATLRRRFGADHPQVTRLADGNRIFVDIELPSG